MSDQIDLSMTIDGDAVTAPDWIDVINPATEAVIGRAPDCTREQLDRAVDAARAAYPGWRDTPYPERQDALGTIAATLMEHAQELQQLLTAEQGKPLADALGEIHAAAWWIGEVAKNELPVTVTDAMPGQRSVTRHVPLGIVGAIVHPATLNTIEK